MTNQGQGTRDQLRSTVERSCRVMLSSGDEFDSSFAARHSLGRGTACPAKETGCQADGDKAEAGRFGRGGHSGSKGKLEAGLRGEVWKNGLVDEGFAHRKAGVGGG